MQHYAPLKGAENNLEKKKKKLLACGTLIPCIMSSYLYFYH